MALKNCIFTKLAAAITSAGQTTGIQLNVTSAEAASFSQIVFDPISDGHGNKISGEIITFTGFTGSLPITLTGVARGAELTTAATYAINYPVAMGMATAGSLPVDLIPQSPVFVRHGGIQKAYADPVSAVAAAVAGDLISVWSDVAVLGNLAKDQVNWYVPAGVTITDSRNDGSFTFDDANSPCSYTIGGQGNFVRLFNSATPIAAPVGPGVFQQSNSASQVNFSFGDMVYSVSDNGAGISTNYSSGMRTTGGSINASGRSITVVYPSNCGAIWWQNGPANYQIGQILYAPSEGSDPGTVYLNCTDHTQGDFYLDVDYLGSTSGANYNNSAFIGGIISTCSDPAAAMWIRAGTIGGSANPLQNLGGKLYVDVEKIFGQISCTNGSGGQLGGGCASQTYISTQKLGGYFAGISMSAITTGGAVSAYANITVGEFDPSDGQNSAFALVGSNSQLVLNGGRWVLFAGQDGLVATSGASGQLGGQITVESGFIISSGGKDINSATGSGTRAATITVQPGSFNTSNTTGSGNIWGVGQLITATLAVGSSVSLTTATPKTVTSITLPALNGTWDVTGVCEFNAATGTTTTYLQAGTNTTTNVLGGQGTYTLLPIAIAGTGNDVAGISAPPNQIKTTVAGTTVVYLVAQAAFAVSTLNAYGMIRARRVL